MIIKEKHGHLPETGVDFGTVLHTNIIQMFCCINKLKHGFTMYKGLRAIPSQLPNLPSGFTILV